MNIGYTVKHSISNHVWDIIYAPVHNDITESDISRKFYLIKLLRMSLDNQVCEIVNINNIL